MKIQIDPKGPTRPTDYAWQEGLGCDHALQLHRSDMVEQLRFVHDELGIRSLRFHGIFDDDMWTIADLRTFSPMPGGGRVREVNFRQCGHVYDNLLSVGVKPFVELSFMPSQLARNGKTGLHYKNHTAPPKDWQEWGDYIRAFIRFLLDRYGAEEVESWWFEVWNEPDLTGFFSGTQKDYFSRWRRGLHRWNQHGYAGACRSRPALCPGALTGTAQSAAPNHCAVFLTWWRRTDSLVPRR